jgi:ABC-2 type transport system permease protein
MFDSGSIRRIKALMTKEAYQIIRDPSSILISGFLPLLLLFLYGFGVSLDLDHLRIGVVLEDSTPAAQDFVQSLTDSRYFDVKIVSDRRELDEDIIAGRIRGIVVIPSYFSQFRGREGQIAPIQVIGDGSEPNTAAFVQNYVAGAYSQWLSQEKISNDLKGLPLVNIAPRFWYNEQLLSRNFLVPGSLAIIMTLIGTLLTALVVAREWERGTMEALMATPVHITELIVAKLIPYFLLGLASMAICVTVAVFVYDIPLRGSIWVLGLVSSAFLFTATQLGLLISTLSKNQFVAAQASIITGFLPAFILSGFLFEISSMPKVIQFITFFIPARYFVACLQTLFLVGNVWSLIIPNILAILAFGIILLLITAKKSSKRLE